MSPEQLQGRDADARSDLFAFGCVLYEMLSGKRAFSGASTASVIAAILEREPEPIQVASALDRVIRKCLAKDPEERFQTARDLKTGLEWAMDQPVAAPAPRPSKRLWWIAAGIAITSAAVGWIAARPARQSSLSSPRVMRFSIPPPEHEVYTNGRISPDGRWLALISADASGKARLWLRGLDSLTARSLADDVQNVGPPIWSPDSRFVAFLQDGKLRKLEISGGAPQTICSAYLLLGGSWNRNGQIIFSGSESVDVVPAQGGTPKSIVSRTYAHRIDRSCFRSFCLTGAISCLRCTAERERTAVFISGPWILPRRGNDCCRRFPMWSTHRDWKTRKMVFCYSLGAMS